MAHRDRPVSGLKVIKVSRNKPSRLSDLSYYIDDLTSVCADPHGRLRSATSTMGQPKKGDGHFFRHIYANLCFAATAIIKAITVEHGRFNGRLYVDPMRRLLTFFRRRVVRRVRRAFVRLSFTFGEPKSRYRDFAAAQSFFALLEK